jgi:predicted Ser/Thr protein kinase
MYATAQERMVEAIGEPKLIDTSADERLGRIFANRTVKIYPSFADFYGMEDTIERIVGYFRMRRRARGAQADSLSARPGRRRQIVACRAAEEADGSSPSTR